MSSFNISGNSLVAPTGADRTTALAQLGESLDINLLFKLMPVFSLGRFQLKLDSLTAHPEQRKIDPVWVEELANLFMKSTPLEDKFPGIAIADDMDWPHAPRGGATHPMQVNDAASPMPAIIVAGQHRCAAKRAYVKKTSGDPLHHVYQFEVYHKGMFL
jgi:hypothetical protein